MKRILEFLVAVLIFIIPSNLFVQLPAQDMYVRGILVDYLIPKLYLADSILVLFFGLVLYTVGAPPFKKWCNKPLILASFFMASLVLFLQKDTINFAASAFYAVQLIKVGALLYYLLKLRFLILSPVVYGAIQVTVLFQSCIGLYQFLYQKSVYGYYFLGEPQIPSSLGLVKEQIAGVERILPYGTTPHPNILAGILTVYSVLLILGFPKKQQLPWQIVTFLILGLSGFVLWTTQSYSAWASYLVALLCIGIQVWQRKIVTLSAVQILSAVIVSTGIATLILKQWQPQTTAIQQTSIERRVILADAAWSMFLKFPLTGVGLNQFTVQLEAYAPNRELVRFIQPVHAVVLLWIAETGLVGIVLVGLVTWLAQLKKIQFPLLLLSLLPIAVFDHYLLSLQSGLLLSVVFYWYIFTKTNQSKAN